MLNIICLACGRSVAIEDGNLSKHHIDRRNTSPYYIGSGRPWRQEPEPTIEQGTATTVIVTNVTSGNHF